MSIYVINPDFSIPNGATYYQAHSWAGDYAASCGGANGFSRVITKDMIAALKCVPYRATTTIDISSAVYVNGVAATTGSVEDNDIIEATVFIEALDVSIATANTDEKAFVKIGYYEETAGWYMSTTSVALLKTCGIVPVKVHVYGQYLKGTKLKISVPPGAYDFLIHRVEFNVISGV